MLSCLIVMGVAKFVCYLDLYMLDSKHWSVVLAFFSFMVVISLISKSIDFLIGGIIMTYSLILTFKNYGKY